MSGRSAHPQPFDASDLRVAVVAASWHTQVMDGLVGARARADGSGSTSPRWSGCPAPSSCRWSPAPRREGYDAVVALGVVIRGGTPHFDYVCQAATDGLTRVSLDTGIPVGFGVLDLRHRGAGPRPGRARGLPRGQGPRGGRRPRWPPRSTIATAGQPTELTTGGAAPLTRVVP